jgi:hypothetical protein
MPKVYWVKGQPWHYWIVCQGRLWSPVKVLLACLAVVIAVIRSACRRSSAGCRRPKAAYWQGCRQGQPGYTGSDATPVGPGLSSVAGEGSFHCRGWRYQPAATGRLAGRQLVGLVTGCSAAVLVCQYWSALLAGSVAGMPGLSRAAAGAKAALAESRATGRIAGIIGWWPSVAFQAPKLHLAGRAARLDQGHYWDAGRRV